MGSCMGKFWYLSFDHEKQILLMNILRIDNIFHPLQHGMKDFLGFYLDFFFQFEFTLTTFYGFEVWGMLFMFIQKRESRMCYSKISKNTNIHIITRKAANEKSMESLLNWSRSFRSMNMQLDFMIEFLSKHKNLN